MIQLTDLKRNCITSINGLPSAEAQRDNVQHGERWFSNNRQVEKIIDEQMRRKKRMAISGMTLSGAIDSVPKGLVGSVGLITTPIATMYQASKITIRKGEKLQLAVKRNLKVIEEDSIKNLKAIEEKMKNQDRKANMTLQLEEISTVL